MPHTAPAQQTAAARTADSLLTYAEKAYLQNLGSALSATQQALVIAREHQQEEAMCKAYTQLGNIYTNTGLYTKALEEFHKALRIARAKSWLVHETEILTSLGNVYYYEDSLSRALSYYEESLKNSQKAKHLRLQARNLTNIGLINMRLGDFTKAEAYSRQSLQICKEIKHQRGICISYQHLGQLMVDLNKLDSAQHYYQEALHIASTYDYLWEEIFIYKGIAELHRRRGQDKEAKKLLYKALAISRQSHSSVAIKDIYELLSEAEAREGNYRLALEYHRLYSKLSDSLNTIAQRTEQEQFYHLLDAERNVSENRVLKANIAAQKHELNASKADKEKQIAISIAVSIALAMAVCLMFFILYHYRQNQKNHKQLRQMHSAIQAQARELESAYTKIQQHNIELENNIEERTRQLNLQNRQLIQYAYFNAHKVRGPLARILGLVNLMPKAAHPLEAEFILDRLDESAKELDKVVHEINLILEVKQTSNQDN